MHKNNILHLRKSRPSIFVTSMSTSSKFLQGSERTHKTRHGGQHTRVFVKFPWVCFCQEFPKFDDIWLHYYKHIKGDFFSGTRCRCSTCFERQTLERNYTHFTTEHYYGTSAADRHSIYRSANSALTVIYNGSKKTEHDQLTTQPTEQLNELTHTVCVNCGLITVFV